MKYKKIIGILLAGAMVCQSFSMGPMVASAEDGSMIGADQLTDKSTVAPAKDAAVPNGNQYKYQKDELAAFCHFGPNTFNNVEWGDKYGDKKPSEIFTLDKNFDAELLVKTIKDAGFKKLIITAKHHDGFCLWNSQYTDYDVESTDYAQQNYDNMGGDILAEISKACTDADLDMGLYLSPWDIHEPSYGNESPGDYNEFYNNQLKEILSNDKYGNNGKFVEIWMDGAKGGGTDPQDYTIDKWYETITEYEGEECMIFGAGPYGTVRWIGNESGLAADETWAKSILKDGKIQNDPSQRPNDFKGDPTDGYSNGYAEGNKWTVPEADARITSGWFWGAGKTAPRNMEQLSNMYFNSVGHNAPLLLNIPPNNQGTVDSAIISRVEEFGNAIKETFDDNIAAADGVSCTASEVRGNDIAYSPDNVLDGNQDTYWTTDDKNEATEATLEVNLGEVKQFDVVSIEEAIQFGQRISEFKVEYKNGADEWKVFGSGKTIGAKRLCRKSPVKADKIRITVKTSEKAEHFAPIISEVGVYRAAEGFAVGSLIPEGIDMIEESGQDFTFSGNWSQDKGDAFTGGTGRWANPGSGVEATVKFKGTKVWILGTVDPNHGTADVYIDDQLVETIDTYGEKRKLQQRIFESDTLSDGEHTLKIVPKNKAIGIDAALVLDNGGKGMFDFEAPSFEVKEEHEAEFTVKRLGGANGKVSVNYAVNPGSAIQDHFDADAKGTITFEDGETEKKFKVQIKTVDVDNLSFTIELNTPSEGTVIGFNTPAKIVIRDGKLIDEENRFQFPARNGDSAILEAELMEIINNTQGDNGWPARIMMEANASNGKLIDNVQENDQVKLYYNAPKTGAYTVTLRYMSGDEKNSIVWSEKDGKIKEGSVTAGATDAAQGVYHDQVFEIEVLEAGEGVLTIVGGEHKAPRLDKFDIVAKNLQTIEYKVTKSAGENGRIEGPDKMEEGTDAVFTIIPDKGYRVSDVKVNGKSVGAVTSYTVENVKMDVAVEATFVKEDFKYTEETPFVFPREKEETKTLEAEYATELINSNESDSDPNWPLQIVNEDWASNGKYVNCLAFKDYIRYAYTATPGKYEITLTYRSGSDVNKLKWSEKDNKIVENQIAVANTAENGSPQVNTTKFEMEVRTDGAGMLSFTAPDTGKGPQIDKFAIKRISEAKPEGEQQADKSNLEALITYAESQKEKAEYEDVVDIVKTLFEKTLAEAKAVMADEKAEQAAVDAAYKSLLANVHLLGFTGNTDDLALALELAKTTNTEGKTPESVKVLQDAIAKAEDILADGNVLQEEIDAAREALLEAIDGLEDIVSVDKTKLKGLLEESQKYVEKIDEYTKATADAFMAAKEAAQAVYDNPEATQEQVKKAYDTLQQAIFGLRLIPNKDALEELLKEAEGINLAKYTEETATVFRTALAKAETVFGNRNASETEVKEAEKMLRAAMDGLEEKKEASEKTDDNAGENGQQGNKKVAKTGDETLPVMWIMLMAAGVVVVFKRKKTL